MCYPNHREHSREGPWRLHPDGTDRQGLQETEVFEAIGHEVEDPALQLSHPVDCHHLGCQAAAW